MRLDDAIRDLSSQKLEKLDPEVLTALRLAAYQIGFLQRVPSHAAVNDSVDLVKRSRKASAAPVCKCHPEETGCESGAA